MKPNYGRIVGVLIFLSVLGLGIGWKLRHRSGESGGAAASGPALTLVGKIGGEKAGLIDDLEVQKILTRFGLTLDVKKAGSVEMIREPVAGQNFLWPASQLNLESFKEQGGRLVQAEEIFHSPLVFYSWDVITDVLTTNGLVERVGETYYVGDLGKLVALIDKKTKWKDIGMTQLYSSMLIHSTDPTKSNSGNAWAGLLANTYNNGELLTPDHSELVVPKVKAFFDRVGFMESGSGTLFDKFLRQGVGAYPIIVAYENQLLEFAAEHRELLEPVRKKLRILYPRPTVWASHPLIALDGNAKRLVAAFKDPDLLRLAWERHGFRAGLLGAVNTSGLPIMGVPPTIDGVMQTPSLPVMTRLTEVLGGSTLR